MKRIQKINPFFLTAESSYQKFHDALVNVELNGFEGYAQSKLLGCVFEVLQNDAVHERPHVSAYYYSGISQ